MELCQIYLTRHKKETTHFREIGGKTSLFVVRFQVGNVRSAIFTQLFSSFLELEKAIESARAAVSKRESPQQEVLDRLTMYEEILGKQRSLALDLGDHAARSNWPEVARHINIINSLSRMIRDDAREIVGSASGKHNQKKQHVEGLLH